METVEDDYYFPKCVRGNEECRAGCEDKCMFADGIPMDKTALDAVVKMEKKYFDLVSYARKSPEDIASLPQLARFIKEAEFLYEEETNALHGEHSDWQHGFHSGALAAFRYVMTISEMGIEQANEDFPELDT